MSFSGTVFIQWTKVHSPPGFSIFLRCDYKSVEPRSRNPFWSFFNNSQSLICIQLFFNLLPEV